MPGFNPVPLAYNVRNANSVAILIGDQTIAFAQRLTHSFGFATEGIYGVGSSKPQEIQQMKNAPTVTVNTFALTDAGESIIQAGQSLPELLANNEFSVCIVDGIANVAQLTYVGCVASDFSEDIGSNAAVSDTIVFLALDVLNQDGVSVLNGQNALTVG